MVALIRDVGQLSPRQSNGGGRPEAVVEERSKSKRRSRWDEEPEESGRKRKRRSRWDEEPENPRAYMNMVDQANFRIELEALIQEHKEYMEEARVLIARDISLDIDNFLKNLGVEEPDPELEALDCRRIELERKFWTLPVGLNDEDRMELRNLERQIRKKACDLLWDKALKDDRPWQEFFDPGLEVAWRDREKRWRKNNAPELLMAMGVEALDVEGEMLSLNCRRIELEQKCFASQPWGLSEKDQKDMEDILDRMFHKAQVTLLLKRGVLVVQEDLVLP